MFLVVLYMVLSIVALFVTRDVEVCLIFLTIAFVVDLSQKFDKFVKEFKEKSNED